MGRGRCEENVLAGRKGRNESPACNRNGEEKGNECDRSGGREAGPGAPHLSSRPLPGRQIIQTLSAAPTGISRGIRSSHSRPYQPRGPRHLGSLFKVRGERRKARAAREVPKHSLMKRFLARGGLAGCPRAGSASASAAAATHMVVMEQVVSILILVVLDHCHRAHQLAHGHLLPGTGDRAQGLRGRSSCTHSDHLWSALRAAHAVLLSAGAGGFPSPETPSGSLGRSMLLPLTIPAAYPPTPPCCRGGHLWV